MNEKKDKANSQEAQAWWNCRHAVSNSKTRSPIRLIYSIETLASELRRKKEVAYETLEFYCTCEKILALESYQLENIITSDGHKIQAARLFNLKLPDWYDGTSPFEIFKKEKNLLELLILHGLRACMHCMFYEGKKKQGCD